MKRFLFILLSPKKAMTVENLIFGESVTFHGSGGGLLIKFRSESITLIKFDDDFSNRRSRKGSPEALKSLFESGNQRDINHENPLRVLALSVLDAIAIPIFYSAAGLFD